MIETWHGQWMEEVSLLFIYPIAPSPLICKLQSRRNPLPPPWCRLRKLCSDGRRNEPEPLGHTVGIQKHNQRPLPPLPGPLSHLPPPSLLLHHSLPLPPSSLIPSPLPKHPPPTQFPNPNPTPLLPRPPPLPPPPPPLLPLRPSLRYPQRLPRLLRPPRQTPLRPPLHPLLPPPPHSHHPPLPPHPLLFLPSPPPSPPPPLPRLPAPPHRLHHPPPRATPLPTLPARLLVSRPRRRRHRVRLGPPSPPPKRLSRQRNDPRRRILLSLLRLP